MILPYPRPASPSSRIRFDRSGGITCAECQDAPGGFIRSKRSRDMENRS
ncbi:MAG: hypothetical protein J0M04_04960 [Verrucomicrobia bacterium]|nr:hypothetical protein [Verrucomicrobiota bacterium]